MNDEFLAWLVKTLRVAHIVSPHDMAAKVVEYLTAFAKAPEDLLGCRDSLATLLLANEEDENVFASDNVDMLADEILSQYHLLMAAAADSDDSGVCPSPIDYDAAFPPLHGDDDDMLYCEPTPPCTPPLPLVYSNGDEQQQQPLLMVAYAPQPPCSFDGTTEPQFVMPRSAAPQPPAMMVGSLPTRIGQGFYPIMPHRLIAPTRAARTRVCSATYDNHDMAMFCVPRIAHHHVRKSSTTIPVNATTHFTPIRSESMSWAYDNDIVPSPPSTLLHRPAPAVAATEWSNDGSATAGQPDLWPVSSLHSSNVWRLMDDDSNNATMQSRHTSQRTDEDDMRLEDEQLLSFVGGLATHAPLDANDE